MITLEKHRSIVTLDPRGGKFAWQFGYRPILARVPGNGRQTHFCFPVFGRPAGPLPGASQPLDRHGFLRTSELTVEQESGTNAILSLTDQTVTDKAALRQTFPFPFRVGLNLNLLEENALQVRLSYRNLSDQTVPVDLALHSYFPYSEAGVALVDMHQQPYEAFSEGIKIGDGILSRQLIGGPLVNRDWRFRAGPENDLCRLLYLDRLMISLETSASKPAVTHWMVWTEPPQGTFLCAEPMISGLQIEPAGTAILDVLIRTNLS
ncbi:MAG: hypothetical protein MUC35_05315 [Candidatus Margulisbacteria bacterium]|jgi:galactose mutarotase-like enzyme|nr:hypothetical protein [Candidatus Margulisiibacteriota bacterium]